MKERPILFNAPMVRALLAGTKTQTRRIVKARDLEWMDVHQGLREPDNAERCPYGQPGGDRLYVRETWAAPHAYDHLSPRLIPQDARIHYAATEDRGGLLWRPSIHMPRWASRITLEVTGVRVERLQDISEKDAIAEGIERTEDFFGCPCWRDYSEPEGPDASVCPDDPIGSFQTLWESTGGDWDANPWVWAIDFKVLSTTGRPA